MAKYLKKSIEKVNSNAESYVDLSDFKEAAPDKQRTGCMSVVCTSGSKRLKLNHDLYAALDEPSSVRVLLAKLPSLLFRTARQVLSSLEKVEFSMTQPL